MRELWKNELLPQLKEELRSELRSEIEAENKRLYSEINAMSESLVKIEESQTFISEKYDKLLEAIHWPLAVLVPNKSNWNQFSYFLYKPSLSNNTVKDCKSQTETPTTKDAE